MMSKEKAPNGTKVLFILLGCSKNRVDGEIMMGKAEEAGYILVDNENDADIIVINTCGFIEDAKKEAISEILNATEQHNNKKVVVTGCLSQRYKEEIQENFPKVSGVLGVFDTDKIVEILDCAAKGEKKSYFGSKKFPDYSSADFEKRIITTPFYYSYLKIADGCDNCCSYCAIPLIRGKYVSRDIKSLVSEANRLADSGVTELIIVAQDTTRYGLDLYKEKKLISLLRELEKIEELKWIRLHYLYPEMIDSDFVEFIKNSEKILNYFDIPIQHISDRILKLMNRRSSKEQIIATLSEIKEKIPDSVIRTSLISGFPTETHDEHKELLSFVKQGWFDRLGVFPYSAEDGTKAKKITGKIPQRIKIERTDEIMDAQSKISYKKNKAKKNSRYTVLTEGYDTIDDVYFGRTYMDSPDIDGLVYFKSDEKIEFGDYVSVQITGYDEYDLTGSI